LWLSQTVEEPPRVVLGDSGSPVEYALVFTIEKAADLIGRVAPLVAAAMSERLCAP
jgi:hypothetical protein